jgi:hypothetical protein
LTTDGGVACEEQSVIGRYTDVRLAANKFPCRAAAFDATFNAAILLGQTEMSHVSQPAFGTCGIAEPTKT